MRRDAILDELRQVESLVAEGERRLAEQEALLVALKQQNQDTRQAQAEWEMMRNYCRQHDEERQRLLSMLQP